MAQIPYDAEKHKGYVLLIRNNRAVWFPPAMAKGSRAQGWKTVKEYNDIQEKRARRKGVAPVLFVEPAKPVPHQKDTHPVTAEPLDTE